MRRQPTLSGGLRAAALLFCLLPTGPAAADPAWWNDPATRIWEIAPQATENWAPVNVGQLKNVAERAESYLDQQLQKGGGAGAAVTAICQFGQTDNYAPATVGQLKNVTKAFYDRLGQIGFNWQTGTFSTPSAPYPWTGTVNAENQAPCNIGQLKNLFSFEISSAFLATDGDGDGIPSWWEQTYGFNPGSAADASLDSDLDLLTNLQEYQLGLNPQSAQSGGAGQPSDYQVSLSVPTFDTDRDGLPNSEDAVPTDPLLMFPPVSESRYALIDLGPGTAHSVNASGQILRAWQTESSGKIVNHAEVMAPIGTGGAPSPVPETYPIWDVIGLSADGTVFFSAIRNDVLDAHNNPALVDRVFWSRQAASAEMSTHSAPIAGTWVPEWRVASVGAGGPVTPGGSLLNGGCSGYVVGYWTWADEDGVGMYGGASAEFNGLLLRWGPSHVTVGINPDAGLSENFYSWYIGPYPVPGPDYNHQPVFSPDPYVTSPLLEATWAAPSHQGAAVHILDDATDAIPHGPNPYNQRSYSFTTNIDILEPVVEALPQAFTTPLATADVPSIPQQSMGPVIFTGINEYANCIAWVRTPTGWQQTEVYSNSGTTDSMGLNMPPHDHPVAPLGRYATAANARGEFLRSNTLWRNGKAHQIEDLISLPQNTGFIASDLNSEGLICGTLVTQTGPRAAILLPVEVVRGKPGSGEIAHKDSLIEEAIPIPEVELLLGSVSISGNTITVPVSGTVKDPLSYLSGNPSDAPATLTFSALGAPVGSIPLTSQVATGQSFSTTLSVPLTHDGSFILRAETSPNSAGLKGFDQSAVSIRWQSSNVALGTPGSSLKLFFPQAPSSTLVNVLQIQENTNPLQTLTETGANTGIYTGEVTLGGASVTCTVQMVNTPVLNGTVADNLPAEIKIVRYTGAQNVITGIWKETGANTKLFANPSIVTQGTASASVGEANEMRGTAKEGAVPFTVRFLGGNLSDDVKLVVGGTEFPMKSFTIDGKTATYPYVTSQPGSPRLFLPSRHPVPANLAVPGFSSSGEGSPLEIKLKTGTGPASSISTLFTVPSESPPDPLALAGSPPPAAGQQAPLPRWHEPGDDITMADLLTAFKILYPDEEAQDLLAKFYAAGGEIKLEDISPDLKVSWWHPGASWAPIIQIEEDDATVGGQKYTPAGAANLLWRGLVQSLGSPAMAQQLDTDEIDWWVAHQQEYVKSAAEITVGATEIYLSGIGMFSEGADLVLVVSEVLDGNGKALVAALPFVSVGMYKYLKKTNGKLRVTHPQDGSIAQMTNQQLGEYAEMYYLGDKLNGAAEVDFELLGPKLREWLTAPGGKIDVKEIGVHGKLRQEFEKISPAPSTNHHCHHDLPWDLREKFAGFGVDVNDPLFGRWITIERHTQIHAAEGYNAWWQTWMTSLNGRVPSRAEILHQISLAHAAFPD